MKKQVIIIVIMIGLLLQGCAEKNTENNMIEMDLQTISHCLIVESGGVYYCAMGDGIYKSDEYPFNWNCIMEGQFRSLSCSNEYLYCCKIVSLDKGTDYSKSVLVKYRLGDMKETVIAEHVSGYAFLDGRIIYQYMPDWEYTKEHKSLRNHYGAIYFVDASGKNRRLIIDDYVIDFWVYSGKLWYTELTESPSEQSFLDYYSYDPQKKAASLMGHSSHGICGSFNNYVFGPAYREDKLAILNTDDFSEKTVEVNGFEKNMTLYIFPSQYIDCFESEVLIYSCNEYVVIGVKSRDKAPYLVGENIVWFD